MVETHFKHVLGSKKQQKAKGGFGAKSEKATEITAATDFKGIAGNIKTEDSGRQQQSISGIQARDKK